MSYISVGGAMAAQAGASGQPMSPMAGQLPSQVNPNQMTQNTINPKAFGDPSTVASVYGQSNPNTFTRSVNGPAFETMDAPPTIPSNIRNAGLATTTPDQGFNNL